MPEIDFDPDLKTAQRVEFNRLNLKKDEKARIALPEKLRFAWVHTLRAPEIVNGEAKKIWKERRGEKYLDFDLGFVGRPMCTGDYGTIKDKGLDAANCPVCERSATSDQVGPPERRFAFNVIRYATNRDGKLSKPFSCSCVVWSFGDKVYNQLTDIKTEYGNLSELDLLLTCKVESFQNYEMLVCKETVWKMNEDAKDRVLQTLKENRLEDVEAACGRKVERRWILDDLEKIASRWRVANGESRGLAVDGTEQSESKNLSDELGSLLDESPKPAPAKADDSVDLAGMIGDLGGDKPKQDNTQKGEDSLDFAKLLGELS